jgi:RimJ/RimL family protein N-acetyltransferase
MSGLMAWADAGVSAAGSTCWEMAFMRLPLILIVTAENQTGIAAGLDEAGCAVNLGWFGQVSESDLADNVSELLFDEKRRGKMSEAGSKIVDGRGADRVIETLGLINSSSKISVNKEEGDQSRELSIRPATASDAELLWRWANDASVRERSFNPEPIPWQSHLDWFSRQLNSPGTSFYLLLEAGDPVGQIRYDRNEEESAAEISFSIAREHRGKGFGTEILLLTRERALLDLNCEKITAVVIEGNEASRKAFVRAGFKSDGPIEIRGRRALRFVWQPTEN